MRVLMCPWTFPDVKWEINPFMHKDDKPDPEKARLEWALLLECYLQLGVKVELLRPRPGLHDMVYTANAGWGRKGVFVLSNFKHKERKGERKFYKSWFIGNGFDVVSIRDQFEGQGDLITTNEGYLCGYGIRSSLGAIEAIKKKLELGKKIIPLRLVDPHFYHLDTCLFSWKPKRLIMYYPEAFTKEDLSQLESLSLDKIEVTREEAESFVCNSVYHGSVALLSGASERILEVFEKRGCKIFVIEGVKDLPRIFERFSRSSLHRPVVIALPKPTELMKGGGSYRCCSLFLD